MIHEVTELLAGNAGVTGWLEHAAYGVNALLAGVPRATVGVGDAAVEDAAPSAVTVASVYEHAWVATDGNPPTVPALVVAVEAGITHGLATGLPQADLLMSNEVTVVCGYFTRDAKSPAAVREAAYVGRAVRRSLLALMPQPHATKTVRGVQLVQLLRLVEMPIGGALGRGGLAGVTVAVCQVADTVTAVRV